MINPSKKVEQGTVRSVVESFRHRPPLRIVGNSGHLHHSSKSRAARCRHQSICNERSQLMAELTLSWVNAFQLQSTY